MISVENRDSTIYVFGRTDRKPYVKKVAFQPYFYAIDENGTHETIDGKKAKKIIVSKPSDVPKVRELYKHMESDVVFVNRYLCDQYHDKEIPNEEIRKMYFDIEVSMLGGVPDIETGDQPIVSIACYDNFLQKYIIFAIAKEQKIANGKTHSYFFYQTEKEMLGKFLQFMQDTDPDMLLGYNLEGFDAPYLINRLKWLKMDGTKLCRCGEKPRTEKQDFGFRNRIFGRILMDEMKVYKKLALNKRESYSLEYISMYELGEGKEKYDGTLDELYENDFDRFIKYNIRDVELIVLLDKKLQMVEYFNSIRKMAKCTFEDVYMNSRVIDSLILCFCKDKYVLPSKKHNVDETFEGAFVVQPPKGLFDMVGWLDVKAMYPSIMMTFNMSYETILNAPEDDCINIDDKYYFTTHRTSILKTLLQQLIDSRDDDRRKMKSLGEGSDEYKRLDMSQYTKKLLVNSIFGVVGFSGFRLYNKKIAEAVAYVGRRMSQEMRSIAEQHHYRVLAGDTDSIGVLMEERTIENVKELTANINKNWDVFVRQFNIKEHFFTLQFEKVYTTLFFSGVKKRYAGRIGWSNGKQVDKIEVVGFSPRRSDSPKIARNFENKLFEMILYKKSKEEVDKFISDFREEIRTAEPSVIAFPIGITKKFSAYKNVPIHVRAVQYSNKYLGGDFRAGEKIKYLYVKKCPAGLPFSNVIAIKDKLPEGIIVDYNRMEERIVNTKVETVYEALGWQEKNEQMNLLEAYS